jgi:hypothetical protein
MQDILNLIQEKSPNAKPLLIVIRGSHAYGTSLPTSDIDYAGVYIQPLEDILGFGYKEQINDDKNDTVIYEIKRFLELVQSNNPNILELLNSPEDCILYKDPVFDEILKHKSDFITKVCAKSFAGYAIQQIKKAKGQDKKQNWDKERVTRKTPIDFCYFHFGSNSVPLVDYLTKKGLDQRFCGLCKVPHSKDTYALYYDFGAEETDGSDLYPKFGFRGIVFENSNDVRLSSIPKEAPFIGYVSYNKDGYTVHCDDYKSYQTWQENKNDARWVDVQSHGQKIDGKNMMHCRRLLEVAKEIAEGKGINVRRPNADYLISIRKGEVDLQTLIDNAENDIKEIDELFKNSNLPDKVEANLINNILINIRKKIYNL